MEETVSIAGLSEAAVLAALYNASKPLGMGILHFDPTPMEEEEAASLLEQQRKMGLDKPYFDYLKGRVMKVRFSGSDINPWGYDRDNGQGAMARVVAKLRGGSPKQWETVDISALREPQEPVTSLEFRLEDGGRETVDKG